jgi:hypothetical protein
MKIHDTMEIFFEVTDKFKFVKTKKIQFTKELVHEPYVYFVPCDKTKKNLGGALLTLTLTLTSQLFFYN